MTTALTIVALTFARCGTPFSVQAIDYEKPTGYANLLSLGLRGLDIPVACALVRLPWGEIERCEGSSSRQSPAHASRPPYSYYKQEAS
ncbi:MAG TPA: hypothetical protein VF043_37670 [Ktedonobacteraceae bacterium]